jgi:glycosyltransferase involved in cell wall biosynthesis
VFHNITPIEFVPEDDRPLIDSSFRQIANIGDADEVWAASEFNRQVLIDYGLSPSKLVTVPLYAKPKYACRDRSEKRLSPLQILYVGRFAKSKGVLDLIPVAEDLIRRNCADFRIVLAGNEQFSDQSYISALKAEIEQKNLERHIEFVGTVDDARLSQLYRQSAILVMPSYHEGFCMPVAEAMASRCVPVAYAAGNIPDLVDGLGKLAPAGDHRRLADLLAETIADLRPPAGQPGFTDPRGRHLSLQAYDHLVAERLEMFSYNKFADTIAERVQRLAVAQKRLSMSA